MIPRWPLRAAAVAIALLGVLDPTLTTRRFARAEVQVIATDAGRDSALVASVVERLGGEFRVIVGDAGDADATVLVGDRLPAGIDARQGPLVAVTPPRPSAWLAIERVAVPREVRRDERVDVQVRVRVVGAAGKSVDVALRDGARIVARSTVRVADADAQVAVALPFVATQAGVARLRVQAALPGNAAESADALIAVGEAPHEVLAFDLRPSWQATFIRRALDADPRLATATRMVSSRGISTARGVAPGSLSDAGALARFAVVVVGAPQLLADLDVAALEGFLRVRGGRVVLLLERSPEGTLTRLTGGSGWQHDSSGRVVDVVGDSLLGRLRGASFAWPARLPPGAEIIAEAGASRPVIYRRPVGEGEVVVVGTLDSWQRRRVSESAFGSFWPNLIAGLAAAAPPPIEVTLEESVLRPGEATSVHVTLRDVATGRAAASTVAATLVDAAGGRTMVRLWPGFAEGALEGTVRAAVSGAGRLEVQRGSDTVSVPLMADPAAVHARPGGADLLARWVAGSGGARVTGDNLARLPDVVHKLIGVEPTPERWHPMHSPWWILPFAFLLATEWWLRRRAGDA